VQTLSAIDSSGADAVAACNALGLFGGAHRLVVVDGVERWRAADADAIGDYLASPTPGTVLALVADELKKRSPLAKACAKAGDVLVYEVAKRDLPRWVGDQFARLGATPDRDACARLLELVGEGLDELAVEVEKLATWAAGGDLGTRDVEELVAPRGEAPPWDLTDAWGRRDVAAVLTAAESLLRSTTMPALVGRLAAHVRRVRTCQRLDAEGVRARDAAARLKLHPFAAEKTYAQARNFSAEELETAIVRLADLDLATKGGTRLPDDLELERTLIAITRPRATGPAKAARAS
jgi:DNA polymerase-3 subunit delta